MFVIIRRDKPDSVGLRKAARPRHLIYLETVIDRIVSGGSMLDSQGQQIGSMLVIDVADQAAAEAFADGDPFVDAGLFESTTIRSFRPVFRDGAWI